jgi:hypothetical protein
VKEGGVSTIKTINRKKLYTNLFKKFKHIATMQEIVEHIMECKECKEKFAEIYRHWEGMTDD